MSKRFVTTKQLMKLVIRSIASMTEEQKAEIRKVLDKAFPRRLRN
jgi:hypothetical protein